MSASFVNMLDTLIMELGQNTCILIWNKASICTTSFPVFHKIMHKNMHILSCQPFQVHWQAWPLTGSLTQASFWNVLLCSMLWYIYLAELNVVWYFTIHNCAWQKYWVHHVLQFSKETKGLHWNGFLEMYLLQSLLIVDLFDNPWPKVVQKPWWDSNNKRYGIHLNHHSLFLSLEHYSH